MTLAQVFYGGGRAVGAIPEYVGPDNVGLIIRRGGRLSPRGRQPPDAGARRPAHCRPRFLDEDDLQDARAVHALHPKPNESRDLSALPLGITYSRACDAPCSVGFGAAEGRGAVWTVPLDRRAALDHLVTPGAFQQRHAQPLARAPRTGERDLARRGAMTPQCTAGTGPPEPLAPLLRIT